MKYGSKGSKFIAVAAIAIAAGAFGGTISQSFAEMSVMVGSADVAV